MSRDKSDADRRGVIEGLSASENPIDRDVAAIMKKISDD
jgi:predicted FMN-binding regulatory protein PaiB